MIQRDTTKDLLLEDFITWVGAVCCRSRRQVLDWLTLMRIAPTFLTLLFIASPCLAEDADGKYKYKQFQLFNHCNPVRFLVEDLSSDAKKIGLTRESMETVVELRLRSSFLYDREAQSNLYVNVYVFKNVFSTSVQYRKLFFDIASGEENLATTWQKGGAGNHGKRADLLRSSISEHVDQFLVEYLRVNEDSCRKRKEP